MIEIGDRAPRFSLESDSGEKVSLGDFVGKKVVLYFYPKDATPGWTREAIDFRDEIDEFRAKNVVVLGVSKDSVASHQKFKAKLEIPFTLLSDPQGEVCNLFGVLKEKSFYGKTRLGVARSTFVIDEAGVVSNVYRGVKVEGHIRELLDVL